MSINTPTPSAQMVIQMKTDNMREGKQAKPNEAYRCKCKSRKGRKMCRFEGDPKRVGASSQKAPFSRGEYGFWCQSCGKVGLKRREIDREMRTTRMQKSIVLVDMFADDPDAYEWLRFTYDLRGATYREEGLE